MMKLSLPVYKLLLLFATCTIVSVEGFECEDYMDFYPNNQTYKYMSQRYKESMIMPITPNCSFRLHSLTGAGYISAGRDTTGSRNVLKPLSISKDSTSNLTILKRVASSNDNDTRFVSLMTHKGAVAVSNNVEHKTERLVLDKSTGEVKVNKSACHNEAIRFITQRYPPICFDGNATLASKPLYVRLLRVPPFGEPQHDYQEYLNVGYNSEGQAKVNIVKVANEPDHCDEYGAPTANVNPGTLFIVNYVYDEHNPAAVCHY